jgi:hypothetical protein
MKFARAGSIGTATTFKKSIGFSDFHSPPEKNGIFAFIWPFIEPFLYMWNPTAVASVEAKGLTKFEYNGMLYAHIGQSAKVVGSWNYIDTADLDEAIRKDNHSLIKAMHKIEGEWGKFRPMNKGVGAGGGFSKDHLEVFIPGRFLGKIR